MQWVVRNKWPTVSNSSISMGQQKHWFLFFLAHNLHLCSCYQVLCNCFLFCFAIGHWCAWYCCIYSLASFLSLSLSAVLFPASSRSSTAVDEGQMKKEIISEKVKSRRQIPLVTNKQRFFIRGSISIHMMVFSVSRNSIDAVKYSDISFEYVYSHIGIIAFHRVFNYYSPLDNSVVFIFLEYFYGCVEKESK